VIEFSDDLVNELMERGWRDYTLHRNKSEDLYDKCEWYKFGWSAAFWSEIGSKEDAERE
jgi:hypothetical protein